MFLFKPQNGQLKGPFTPKNLKLYNFSLSYDVCLLWNIMKLDCTCSKSPKTHLKKLNSNIFFHNFEMRRNLFNLNSAGFFPPFSSQNNITFMVAFWSCNRSTWPIAEVLQRPLLYYKANYSKHPNMLIDCKFRTGYYCSSNLNFSKRMSESWIKHDSLTNRSHHRRKNESTQRQEAS